MNKLNLGCGYVQPDGWINVDKLDYGQDLVADLLSGLPFKDNYFDLVLMNHTLQMFTYNEHEAALKEVRRVMKPGATLRILTPDMQEAVEKFIEGTGEYPISEDLEPTLSGRFARYLFWHGDTRCAFDVFSLPDLLERNYFINVRRAEFGECELDSREAESLIMTCQK